MYDHQASEYTVHVIAQYLQEEDQKWVQMGKIPGDMQHTDPYPEWGLNAR